MSKRSREDNLELLSTVPETKDKPKKRKVRHEQSSAPQDEEATLSKAERKEQKRLKKLKKAQGADDSKSATPDNLKDINGHSEEVVEEVEPDKATAKAARKAEKKRLKALSKAEDGVTTTITSENTSSEKKLSKAERKAEKKRKHTLQQDPELDLSTEANGNASPSGPDDKQQESLSEVRSGQKEDRKEKKKKHKANGDKEHVKGEALSPTNGAAPAANANTTANVDEFLSSNFISIVDPTTKKPLSPITEFSQLPSDAHPSPSPFTKFKNPTPIQAASWPFLLAGRDVVGVAETGSGKTLAFGVPCLRHITQLPKAKGPPARAVIVSPTRELAVQIYDQIAVIAKSVGLLAVCVYGGVPKDAQREDLKRAHIIVATPGRLNDFVDEGGAQLGNVSYMVLDEADRMLDKGFEDAIRKIISSAGPAATRQTLMFTATWPPAIRELASTFMRQPVKIAIGDNPTGELRANTRIEQKVEVVDPRGKEQRLIQLLKQYQSGVAKNNRILVFCLYKKEATRVEGMLRSKGLRVAGIHGDLSQEKRAASLESFKAGNTPLLVATDVAARGLDIPEVKVVINVTFPLTVEDYVHRIGRTGRAGADGLAITLFTEHDKAHSGALINVLKAAQQPVPEDLFKFGTTVKKKAHDAYGAFYKENTDGKEATKIKFDD